MYPSIARKSVFICQYFTILRWYIIHTYPSKLPNITQTKQSQASAWAIIMDFTVQAALFICNAWLLWTRNRIDAMKWINPGLNPITETSVFLADAFLSYTHMNNNGCAGLLSRCHLSYLYKRHRVFTKFTSYLLVLTEFLYTLMPLRRAT